MNGFDTKMNSTGGRQHLDCLAGTSPIECMCDRRKTRNAVKRYVGPIRRDECVNVDLIGFEISNRDGGSDRYNVIKKLQSVHVFRAFRVRLEER